MYAGNVGFSQSLDLRRWRPRSALPDVTFVVNGDGAAERRSRRGRRIWPTSASPATSRGSGCAEVLASGDVHVVPLRAGLGNVSVPSKTYSILAAGRPVLAAIDPGTEVPTDRSRRPGQAVGRAARRSRGVRRRGARPARRSRPAGRAWARPAGRGSSARRVAGGGRRTALRGAACDELARAAGPPRVHRRPADSLSPSWPRPHRPPAKKVAKLAQRGKGKKVRFQGGTLFPAASCSVVVVLGLLTVVYARQSRPDADAVRRRRSATTGTPRTASTSATPGCRSSTGNQEETDDRHRRRAVRQRGLRAHRHPQPRRRRHPLAPVHVGGRRQARQARRVPRHYDVELTNDKLTFPEPTCGLPYQQETGVFEEGETTCADGERRRAQGRRVGQLHRHRQRHRRTSPTSTDIRHRQRRHGRSPSPFVPDGHRGRACRRGRRTCPSLGAVDTGQLAHRPTLVAGLVGPR